MSRCNSPLGSSEALFVGCALGAGHDGPHLSAGALAAREGRVERIVRDRCPWVHRVWVGNYRNGVRDALAGQPSRPPRSIVAGDPHIEKVARAYALGYQHGEGAAGT